MFRLLVTLSLRDELHVREQPKICKKWGDLETALMSIAIMF